MPLIKKTVSVSGHMTSMTLEPEFWQALETIRSKQNKSLNYLVSEIDEARGDYNLSSATRVFILKQLLNETFK